MVLDSRGLDNVLKVVIQLEAMSKVEREREREREMAQHAYY